MSESVSPGDKVYIVESIEWGPAPAMNCLYILSATDIFTQVIPWIEVKALSGLVTLTGIRYD